MEMPGKYGAIEQNQIISKARKRRLKVYVFLKNGSVLKGRIQKFDIFSILMKAEKGFIMVYKHAISTIIPLKGKKSKKNVHKKQNQKKKK